MPLRTFTNKTDRVITVTKDNMYINTNIINISRKQANNAVLSPNCN